MKTSKCYVIMMLWMTFMLYDNTICPASPYNVDAVKTALVRWMCMEYYWMGGWIQPGTTIPITVKFEGNKFFVWASDQLIKNDTRSFGFYWGRIKGPDTTIIMREAFATDLKGGGQTSPLFVTRKQLFDSKDVYNDHVSLPPDCPPRYDPLSPKKSAMIRNIINTLRHALIIGSKSGGKITNDQNKATLTIADFNIDYPYAYVLVEPRGLVYIVTLHDFENYDSGEYDRMEYAWNTVNDKEWTADLISKIRKHGITEIITLRK